IAFAGTIKPSVPPSVKFITPQPNTVIQQGQAYTIQWNVISGGWKVLKQVVQLSTDGGATFKTLPFADNLAGDAQQINFTAPNQAISQAQIKITSTDLIGQVGVTTSGIFGIGTAPPPDTQPPTVKFFMPQGGEVFMPGD